MVRRHKRLSGTMQLEDRRQCAGRLSRDHCGGAGVTSRSALLMLSLFLKKTRETPAVR